MKIMNKNLSKIVIAVIIIFSVVFNFNTSAFAEDIVISKVETKRIANLPTKTFGDENFKYVGGIAVGKAKNSMFAVKASSQEETAAFYYYPDIEKPTNYAIFRLRYAGHANAMAINNGNVFVAGWVYNNKNLQTNNKYNNWIIMVPRKTIAAMPFNKDGKIIPKDNKDTEEVEGFSVLYPKVKHTAADGTVTYTDYTKTIVSITKYNSDKTFIIGCGKQGDDFIYTTAKLETNNGKTLFVVSQNAADMFVIKNNLQDKTSIGQDVCYSPGNGFFAPLWGGKKFKDESGTIANEYYNPNKNVIMWADIDKASDSHITVNGKSCRYYTPQKINVNKSSEKEYGVKKYSQFEIESIAFTEDNRMLFCCNIEYNQDYETAYKKNNSDKTPSHDGIFELTHDNGKKFIL